MKLNARSKRSAGFKTLMTAEDCVVAHLERYRLSLPFVIQQTCFQGRACDDHLRSMQVRGMIKQQVDQTTGLQYFQITYAEAERRRININRAHALKPSELREALAVLWFCCMSGTRRSRVSRNKLGKEFGRG